MPNEPQAKKMRDDKDLRRMFFGGVALAVNGVIALASAGFFVGVGLGVAGPQFDALSFLGFAVGWAVMVMVVCVARVTVLSWLLTGLSAFFFIIALIVAGETMGR